MDPSANELERRLMSIYEKNGPFMNGHKLLELQILIELLRTMEKLLKSLKEQA